MALAASHCRILVAMPRGQRPLPFRRLGLSSSSSSFSMTGAPRSGVQATDTTQATDTVISRAKVREAAGVFHSRQQIEDAIKALLSAGFDRADIDLMASARAVREKLDSAYVAVEELADVPNVPRKSFIARDDVTTMVATVAGILTFIGATASATAVVASGGAVALAAVAALVGGGLTGGTGAFLIHQVVEQQWGEELETLMEAGGLILWVRVHNPEQEKRAIETLRNLGGEAVRVHEIEIEKRLDDIPLSSIRPDPLHRWGSSKEPRQLARRGTLREPTEAAEVKQPPCGIAKPPASSASWSAI